jgi:predicted nucleic acid-binding Zn ribbon protein
MARGPQPIADVLAQLMAHRGFAAQRRAAASEMAWREAAGDLVARYSRVGANRRGRLDITVANSTLLQELSFRKPALLEALAARLPDEGIKDLRFYVGPID